jgi:Spy/CpxP family protein refolding chaperone
MKHRVLMTVFILTVSTQLVMGHCGSCGTGKKEVLGKDCGTPRIETLNKDLNLTERQATQIKAIEDKANAQIMAILTKDQHAKLKKEKNCTACKK